MTAFTDYLEAVEAIETAVTNSSAPKSIGHDDLGGLIANLFDTDWLQNMKTFDTCATLDGRVPYAFTRGRADTSDKGGGLWFYVGNTFQESQRYSITDRYGLDYLSSAEPDGQKLLYRRSERVLTPEMWLAHSRLVDANADHSAPLQRMFTYACSTAFSASFPDRINELYFPANEYRSDEPLTLIRPVLNITMDGVIFTPAASRITAITIELSNTAIEFPASGDGVTGFAGWPRLILGCRKGRYTGDTEPYWARIGTGDIRRVTFSDGSGTLPARGNSIEWLSGASEGTVVAAYGNRNGYTPNSGALYIDFNSGTPLAVGHVLMTAGGFTATVDAVMNDYAFQSSYPIETTEPYTTYNEERLRYIQEPDCGVDIVGGYRPESNLTIARADHYCVGVRVGVDDQSLHSPFHAHAVGGIKMDILSTRSTKVGLLMHCHRSRTDYEMTVSYSGGGGTQPAIDAIVTWDGGASSGKVRSRTGTAASGSLKMWLQTGSVPTSSPQDTLACAGWTGTPVVTAVSYSSGPFTNGNTIDYRGSFTSSSEITSGKANYGILITAVASGTGSTSPPNGNTFTGGMLEGWTRSFGSFPAVDSTALLIDMSAYNYFDRMRHESGSAYRIVNRNPVTRGNRLPGIEYYSVFNNPAATTRPVHNYRYNPVGIFDTQGLHEPTGSLDFQLLAKFNAEECVMSGASRIYLPDPWVTIWYANTVNANTTTPWDPFMPTVESSHTAFLLQSHLRSEIVHSSHRPLGVVIDIDELPDSHSFLLRVVTNQVVATWTSGGTGTLPAIGSVVSWGSGANGMVLSNSGTASAGSLTMDMLTGSFPDPGDVLTVSSPSFSATVSSISAGVRFRWHGFNPSGVLIDPTVTPFCLSHQGASDNIFPNGVSNYQFYAPGGPARWFQWGVIPSAGVRRLYITCYPENMIQGYRSFEIWTRSAKCHVVSRSDLRGRASEFVPSISGHFMKEQYVTTRSNGIQRCTTQGYGVQAWADGATVVRGEYRHAGGYVYCAESPGTAGSTDPTGTSRSFDGTIWWRYVGPYTATAAFTTLNRQSGTGETAGFTQGETPVEVYAESTFTGNVGATAYNLSDVVKHLKNAGILTP